MAATNRDLARRTQSGEFREDLLYRLSAITIKLPPLRQRGADIELLADALQASINCQFQQQHGDTYQHKILSADAKKFVSRQPWPGNVRQLRNTLVQATVMSSAAELQASDLAAAIADFPGLDPATSLDPPLGDDFEIDEYLDQVPSDLSAEQCAKPMAWSFELPSFLACPTTKPFPNRSTVLN